MLYRLMGVARSTTNYQPRGRHLKPQCDPLCVEAVSAVIEAHPTYGVRMIHARLTKGKAGHYRQPQKGPPHHEVAQLDLQTASHQPSASRSASQIHRRDTQPTWATDIASMDCGRDDWCAFVPIIDCCSREVLA